MNVLEVKDLKLAFESNKNVIQVLKGISFSLAKGKTLGIVGESGSGKTVTAMSILKLLPKNAIISGGTISFNDGDKNVDILSLSEKELLKLRGNNISMIFQEPMTSLNPSIKCGYQVGEILSTHSNLTKKEIKQKVLSLFGEVKLPDPERIFDSYPFEISGGQKQRVMIAMAIATNPKLIIADEPTTALDVTVQKAILELLKEIQERYEISILFISHDLSVISQIADDIIVMYKGEIVEKGSKNQILSSPNHQYTKGLLSCRPNKNFKGKHLPTLSDYFSGKEVNGVENSIVDEKVYNELILSVNKVSKTFTTKKNIFGKALQSTLAVNDISFKVFKGETLGLVGESGCGKTTLGRIIVQLINSTSGNITYKGINLKKNQLSEFRKKVQIVFQDPYSALNPKKTVGDLILEPLVVHNIGKSLSERKQMVLSMLKKVSLSEESFSKYPHEFSGGQRQRIVIARALILKPEFVICDESVSALDVSVQAEVLNLLNDLKMEFGLTYIFISHDLNVVKYMSDRIMVMKHGKLVEINKADEVYYSPASNYTKKLIDSIPEIIID